VAARMSPCAPATVRIGRKSPFLGSRLGVGPRRSKMVPRNLVASPVQMNLAFAKSTKWWEKGMQPNMREIESAQDLVDSLANAGDRLVIVDFFSPGCGGCRALHPKVKNYRKMYNYGNISVLLLPCS
jgi:thiol-disulfide isomerase/thioredoxin